tara:strand:+ start:297 stop:695 length:399 start_codon:yes stop_codon:yes gene_type:complete
MARVDYTAKGVSADQIKRIDGADGRDNAKAFAARRDGIDVSAVQEGVNIGPLTPAGVDGADSFVGYTPIHKIDNPSDGINDGASYVVYFQKDGTDPTEFYKAVNANVSTLAQLTSGTEYDLASSKKLNAGQG